MAQPSVNHIITKKVRVPIRGKHGYEWVVDRPYLKSYQNDGKLKAVHSKLPKILSIEAKKFVLSMIMAEKEGFEPSHRLPRSTPLAGEPLRPNLGTSPSIKASTL